MGGHINYHCMGTIWMILCCVGAATCWYSTARDLLEHGDLLKEVTDKYIDTEQQKLDKIKSIAASIRNKVSPLSLSEKKDVGGAVPNLTEVELDEFVGHPLNAFHTIKAWTQLKQLGTERGRQSHYVFYRDFLAAKTRLPPEDTERTLRKNLLQLQAYHHIPTADMVHGDLIGHQTDHPLTAEDMYKIGQMASEQLSPMLAAEWLTHALIQADAGSGTLVVNIVSGLMKCLRQLIHQGDVKAVTVLDLEHWIYVDNRKESRRVDVATSLLDILHWSEEDSSPDVAVYNACSNPQQQQHIITEGVHFTKDFLTEEQIQGIKTFGQSLFDLSFEVEGMRMRTSPDTLRPEHLSFMRETLESLVSPVQSVYPHVNLKEAVETTHYSFEVHYDPAGGEGFHFFVENFDFSRRKYEQAITGLHIMFMASECSGGAVAPMGSTVSTEKGLLLVWTRDRLTYDEQQITKCPVLFGERWLLHLFVEIGNR